jgi:hypothetical protein
LPSHSPQGLVSTISPAFVDKEKPEKSEHDVVLKFHGAEATAIIFLLAKLADQSLNVSAL